MTRSHPVFVKQHFAELRAAVAGVADMPLESPQMPATGGFGCETCRHSGKHGPDAFRAVLGEVAKPRLGWTARAVWPVRAGEGLLRELNNPQACSARGPLNIALYGVAP